MTARVLVIDDARVTRRVVIHALKSMNIETIEAANGMEALEFATNEYFDMFIVDINLPDIDGFEVMAQLNQLANSRDVPKIMFTARHEPQDQSRAAEVGALGFLYKPFSTQELRDLVNRHLAGR